MTISAPSTRILLVVATSGLFLVRLALDTARTGPLVVADEIGYLTNARVLAGGVPGQMSLAPFYRGGYSLLIAPILAAAGSPETAYRLVLVVNAALAAALVPLVYLLLTRCVGASRVAAVGSALAAGLYPSVTSYSQVALSENLLLPLFVAWLLCWGIAVRSRSNRSVTTWTTAAAACAVALWATHGRMIVVLAVTVAALAALALVRERGPRLVLPACVVVAGGIAAVHVLDSFLIRRSYGGHAPDEAGQRLSTLGTASGVGGFLRNLIGQSWYVAVASLGLALVAAAPTPSVVRNLRCRRASVADVVLALTLLTGVGLLVVSALSFPDAVRPDMLIYGRYVEPVVPPLLALGLLRIASSKRRSAAPVAAVIAAATVATALLRVTISPTGGANRWNVASIPFITSDLGPAVIVGAGAMTLLVIGALTRLRAPLHHLLVVLGVFLATALVVEHNPVLSGEHAFYPSGWTSPAQAIGGSRTAAFDTDGSGSLYVYQWFIPKARLVLFASETQPPPSRLVITSDSWAARHRGLDPVRLWEDRSRGSAIFRVAPGRA